jgi:hypothetical protein
MFVLRYVGVLERVVKRVCVSRGLLNDVFEEAWSCSYVGELYCAHLLCRLGGEKTKRRTFGELS